MENNFNSLFKKQIEEEIDFGPVQRFALLRGNKEIKHFVFVEGATDEQFYSNTNIETLHNKAQYFYKKMNEPDELKGKEAVFYSLKRVVENEKLSQDLDSCVFIVDRDFSTRIMSKNVRLKSADYDKVSITLGHSMENYFLEQSNVKILFEMLQINDNKFWDFFCDFASGMGRYYAFKAIITENYNTGMNIKFKRKYNDNELFDFDFYKNTENREYWESFKFVEEECNRMQIGLQRYSYLLAKEKEIEKRIKANPRYIRGHDAFNFLQCYLLQIYHMKLTFDKSNFGNMKSVIEKFDVEICRK